jgi:serine/threonine protein kinase
LNDLLRGLLQKDPKDRLTWNELREHEFWKEKIEPPVNEIKYSAPFSLPVNEEEQEDEEVNEVTTPIDQSTEKQRKDVMRLSKIVKSNLEKEQGPSYENGNEEGRKDNRKNTDMEYNFEEDNIDDRGESTTDIDETDSVINISQNTPSSGNVITDTKFEQPSSTRVKSPVADGSPRLVPSLALGSSSITSVPVSSTREYKKAVPEDVHKVCFYDTCFNIL